MRRAAAAVALTAIGIWLVLSFKSSPVPRLATTGGPAPGATAPASTADQGGQAPAGPAPPGSGSGTTSTTGSGSGLRTVDGSVVSTRYGKVQVAVVLSGSRISDVKALQLPFDRSRSADISAQAGPMLHDEVIQAQSAQIDTIGGATYTSSGYVRSLQSALDQARG
jgi:uncharacterized protein with FMN-binding domain